MVTSVTLTERATRITRAFFLSPTTVHSAAAGIEACYIPKYGHVSLNVRGFMTERINNLFDVPSAADACMHIETYI